LLLADDHRLFNDGLKALLSDDFTVVAQVFSGTAIAPAVLRHDPDVLLLDFNLPGLNGLEAARTLLADFPTLRIVLLTMYNEPRIVEEFRLLGARGFLLKTASKEELTLAIRLVVGGGLYFPPPAGKAADAAHADDAFLKQFLLTPREVDIIRLVQEGLSSKQIADRLGLSPFTVDTHRKNIYVKLGISTVAELVNFAGKLGL